MAETLPDLFPDPVLIRLDTDRELRICVRGWRHLERTYGNTRGALEVLKTIEDGEGKVYTDLPVFMYACLMDRDGKSPLAPDGLDLLIDQGADLNEWRTAVSKAVLNFFRPRTTGRKTERAARGPGSGLIGWFAALLAGRKRNSGA